MNLQQSKTIRRMARMMVNVKVRRSNGGKVHCTVRMICRCSLLDFISRIYRAGIIYIISELLRCGWLSLPCFRPNGCSVEQNNLIFDLYFHPCWCCVFSRGRKYKFSGAGAWRLRGHSIGRFAHAVWCCPAGRGVHGQWEHAYRWEVSYGIV